MTVQPRTTFDPNQWGSGTNPTTPAPPPVTTTPSQPPAPEGTSEHKGRTIGMYPEYSFDSTYIDPPVNNA